MKDIGITTTVPVEILMAAGYRPIDLNNILVDDSNPERFINMAEADGFPQTCCTWIKGIYGVCRETGIENILGVTGGDCSNTLMLLDVLSLKGHKVLEFAYPELADVALVSSDLTTLAKNLGTTLAEAEAIRNSLDTCRNAVQELDDMTWQKNNVTGWENHLWQVSSSDFNQNPETFVRDVCQVIEECRKRPSYAPDSLRLAYIGVPPVFAGEFYPFIEKQNAHVVYNEIQRQFNMVFRGNGLAEQYTKYTYPYSVWGRLEDISQEVPRRRVDGIIHYVQAFCHRGISDIVFREKLSLPMLTIEGNDEFFLSNHLKTRLEAFVDMIRIKKQKSANEDA
ncbi:2-hydroxyacyl-CoA dehydratase family protein [Chloroflexota bacterium]